MYTHPILDRYPHVCEDETRAIPVTAQQEEDVDIPTGVILSGSAEKWKAASRGTRELLISGYEKFANYIKDDRNHSGAVEQEMERKGVKKAKAETVDAT